MTKNRFKEDCHTEREPERERENVNRQHESVQKEEGKTEMQIEKRNRERGAHDESKRGNRRKK